MVVVAKVRQAVIKRYFGGALRTFFLEPGELAKAHMDFGSGLGRVFAAENARLAREGVFLVGAVSDLFGAFLTNYMKRVKGS